MRGIKITGAVIGALVVLAGAFVGVQLSRPVPEPKWSSTVVDGYTFPGKSASLAWPPEGQAVVTVQDVGSLGSYGDAEPVPIASVAKVMTAYVILRDHPLEKGEEITIDQKAEDEAKLSAEGESTVQLRAGDTISEADALEALMIASGNNVARMLARWDAGSEEAFVAKMNEAAAELGMTDTTYTDPSGLLDSTVSTAADQVKLGRRIMRDADFREIAEQPEYVGSDGATYSNWNRLVGQDGVVGIKTGTTTPAGGNLLFAAEDKVGGEEHLIIGAVLGQHEPPIIDTVLAESKSLILSTQDALEARTVVRRGEVAGTIDDGFGNRIPAVTAKRVRTVGWPGYRIDLDTETTPLPSSATAGSAVGTLTVGKESVPLVLDRPLTEPGFWDRLGQGL